MCMCMYLTVLNRAIEKFKMHFWFGFEHCIIQSEMMKKKEFENEDGKFKCNRFSSESVSDIHTFELS